MKVIRLPRMTTRRLMIAVAAIGLMISVGDGEASVGIAFYYFGHYSEFAARNVIPNEQARAGVLWYAKNGTLPTEVAWEQG